MRKFMPCILVVLLLGGGGGGVLLTSCKGKSSGTAGGEPEKLAFTSYPIKTDVTLNYWLAVNTNVSPNFTNLGNTPFAKGLQERTGVKLNFLHPPTGSTAAQEQLNLMIADGSNMPDIMEWNWLTNYPGGPEKAIDDGVILKLNDIIDKYCPNLKAYLKAHPDYDRMVKTDNGSYYVFPFIRGAEKLLYSQGLMIRKDWLDDLGLQPPETIDELHDVLVAFRDKKGATAPFTIVFTNTQRLFFSSFGMLKTWYISADDGKIHFGQVEPNYRRWLETMSRWYKEGLIDKDFASVQTAQQNQKMTTGVSGATVASVGSGIGTWTPAARATTPKYEIIALPDPVLTKGQKRVYAVPNQPYSGQDSAVITPSSKNIEIAARFLDWGYTDAGHLYYNFGIEGESYTMVNGKPIYTASVMSGGPNKWPLAQSMSAYVRSTGAGPFIQNEGYIEQYYALPEQAQALANYVVPGANKYGLPAITATQAESRELATIMNEVNTYAEEMMTKFILGTETLNDASWNNYISTVKRMNIDRAIAIQNGALDRYKQR